MSRSIGAVVLGVLLLLASPAPASAHSALLASTPADGSVVTTVTTEVTLTFNEPVLGDFTTVTVTGPGGEAFADGSVRAVDNVVHQPVRPLPSGSYQVAWRAASADGHPISGTFSFTVALPEPSVTTPPAVSTATPDLSTRPVEPDPEGGRSAWWWALPALVVLAGAAWLILRRAR